MSAEKLLRRILSMRPAGEPFTVVDIGSMGGIEKEWARVKDQIRCIGFEPDPREFANLKSSDNEIYFNCALHRTDGFPLTIHLSREPGKSSIFRPNMDRLRSFPDVRRFETVGAVELSGQNVRSLDSLVESERLGRIHFLKLDTQGSELFILEGGRKTLDDSVVGVKVEVEFQELYDGQPLFSDVDRFLRGLGFDLMDLRRVFWRKDLHRSFSGKGQLVFGDALYLKNPARLLGADKSPANRLLSALSFATAAVAYGVHDAAAEVLQLAGRKDPENLGMVQSAWEMIRRHDQATRIPRFWGTEKIFRILERASRMIGHQRHAFAESDIDLGNRRIG